MNNVIAGMAFRRLTPADAQELSYLELELFPTPWSANSLRSCLELANVSGEAVTVAGKIVAYLFVQFAADEVHILNIGVREAHRRQGLASALLYRLYDLARERKSKLCYLEVRSGNLGAQKLYFEHGFMPLSVRKKYYPNGEDALILMKEL